MHTSGLHKPASPPSSVALPARCHAATCSHSPRRRRRRHVGVGHPRGDSTGGDDCSADAVPPPSRDACACSSRGDDGWCGGVRGGITGGGHAAGGGDPEAQNPETYILNP
jgi:hypothetical protein